MPRRQDHMTCEGVPISLLYQKVLWRSTLEHIIERILTKLPFDPQALREDFSNHLRATLSQVFSEYDLITRTEFERHKQALAHLQTKVAQLEASVEALEKAKKA